jgi:hypothetical protein
MKALDDYKIELLSKAKEKLCELILNITTAFSLQLE